LLPVLIQALILAFSGLLSPGSITLVILLLISDRSWHNGLGYALGYTSAYTLIGISVVVLGYRTTENNAGEPSLFLPVLLIVLGSLLLLLALRNWRKPISEDKEEPRFFSIVDKITPMKAFGLGALVSVVNFSHLERPGHKREIIHHGTGSAGVLPVCDHPRPYLYRVSQTRKRSAQWAQTILEPQQSPDRNLGTVRLWIAPVH
jgi:hypothetical protein